MKTIIAKIAAFVTGRVHNSTLTRKTQLRSKSKPRRSAIARKRRRGDKPQLRIDWLNEHLSCACCGKDWLAFDCRLAVHHILGGAYGRPDHVANFLALCAECHALCHANTLTRPMQLQLKLETNSEQYDHAWLASRMGRRILEQPEPVPDELRRRT